jgi:hypothetical protein
METERLIDSLAADLQPVCRLRPPLWRLAGWLAVAGTATGLVVAANGLRPDLAAMLAQPNYAGEQAMALVTALVAGWAALWACVPGAARWKLLLPLIPLALWMATLGAQCWDEWVHLGIDGMRVAPDLDCVASIAWIGAVPALAMVFLIRRGAGLHGRIALFWGTMAAAGLAEFGLRLFHDHDAALMVAFWQFGSIALYSAVAALAQSLLAPEHRPGAPA